MIRVISKEESKADRKELVDWVKERLKEDDVDFRNFLFFARQWYKSLK